MEDLKGYEGFYSITREGKIYSHRQNKFLKPGIDGHGYLHVVLWGRNKWIKTMKIHRLIALQFIPNPHSCMYINHKDGNKMNNLIDNLEWCTQAQNLLHAYSTKLKIASHKEQPTKHVGVYAMKNGGELIFYKSLTDAALKNNILVTAINNCLKGRARTAGGFIWTYA